jgi:hypothetical protein
VSKITGVICPGQDPEEVSRVVGVVIVVYKAFSMLVIAAHIAVPLLSS